ncbi:hypothetical protein [Flavobacterium cerinum]|uniref:Uncharacterized protein n=1 Tax=Flavobacterium cerinum TaxID=2502784 RepID=A0A444H8S6_9FLAO|nr:hypothetical protein [Flavobacterium cerinum]RWW99549.1 hypothetical protein EPI11_11390 [Flavobacterium cerinum]
MEKQLKGFFKASFLATLFLPTISNAQQDLPFTITPQLTKEVIEGKISNFKTYHVTQKEIEYHPYIEGQVNTNDYNFLLATLNQYKPEYDEYVKDVSKDSIVRNDLKKISHNIELYLSSNEKLDIKDKYLIDAQSIADKHNIEIKGENTSLFAKKVNDHGLIKNDTKAFRLHNGKKPSSKKDIEFYKNEIEKMKFPEVRISNGAKKYLEFKEKEKTIQKTQFGKVLSSEILKRKVFMIDNEMDINALSGEFIELPVKYMLALKDIENKFVKNELTDDTKDYYNVGGLSQRYSLIKKKDTDEYYYIMSDAYLSDLLTKQREKELLEIVHKLGYKEYREGEDLYIKSKTAEIRLDVGTYNELKKNSNYITTLDNDQSQIASLIKQTVSHSKLLDKYLSLYRIQKSKMSNADINAWRTATTNAQKLMLQINKLSEKYDGNYSFTLLNKSNMLDAFSDNLLASKGVLRM